MWTNIASLLFIFYLIVFTKQIVIERDTLTMKPRKEDLNGIGDFLMRRIKIGFLLSCRTFKLGENQLNPLQYIFLE